MPLLDTNVLVYGATRSAPEHERCRALLEETRRGDLPWFLTWSIVYEFLRVVTHRRVLEHPWGLREAWAFVAELLQSPALEVLAATERHPRVAEQTLSESPELSGNALHDAHIAVLMREHGVKRIITRDTGFHRFPFLEVVDPLR